MSPGGPNVLIRFWLSNGGATAIEYSFIAGLISVAIVVGASAVGVALPGRFQPLATALS